MNTRNQQQVLNLQLTPANTFDSFYPGKDQTLMSVLKKCGIWNFAGATNISLGKRKKLAKLTYCRRCVMWPLVRKKE